MTSPWTSFFTQNLGLKLVALLLALAVYAHVQTEMLHEMRLSSPLVLRGLPRNLVLVGEPPPRAEITVRAKGKELFLMRVRAPEVVVDLSEARSGEIQRILSPADVALPLDSDAVIAAIHEPRTLTLQVDSLVTRSVPVEVPLLGDLPETWAWRGAVRADPPRVEIHGPSRRVAGIERAGTVALNLATVNGPSTRRVAIESPGPGIEAQPDTVAVTVPVHRVERRTFGPFPLRIAGMRRGFAGETDPDSALVVLTGVAERLRALEPSQLDLFVDVRDLAAGRHQAAPQVRLLVDSLEVREIVPPRVFVRLASAGP